MSERKPPANRAELLAEFERVSDRIEADARFMPVGIETQAAILWRRMSLLEQVVGRMLEGDFDMAEPPQRTGEEGGT